MNKRAYPTPNIDDAINQLKGNKFFIQLDLAQRYYQIVIPIEERFKTAFVTEFRCYQYTRLPMGLSDAPSYFQETINKVLSELKYNCCFCYFDDIIVYGKTNDQLCEDFIKVSKRLRLYGLKSRVEN